MRERKEYAAPTVSSERIELGVHAYGVNLGACTTEMSVVRGCTNPVTRQPCTKFIY